MKKFITRIIPTVLVASILLSLAGCTSTPKHILPTVNYGGEGNFSIVHVTNMEEDVVLFVDPDNPNTYHKLLHDDYVQWNSISYAWLIKHEETLVGWIYISGGSQTDNKDKSKYSYGILVENSKTFADTNISVYLLDTDEKFMTDNFSISANCGSISRQNVLKDAHYACAGYLYDLSGVLPKDNPTIEITIGFHS